MSTRVRWGIAATGRIARAFAEALTFVDDAALVAVASRVPERARVFADDLGVPQAHGSYEELAEDPGVDVVYVATPHSRHCDDTLLFLEAGKHVLCEKPMALNAAQVRRMVAGARRNSCFLMEALWSRHLPAYRELTRLLGDGAIGTPVLVDADFGFRVPVDPTHRLFDRLLGGGALLDLGVYPLQLAFLVLGHPTEIHAVARLGSTGVDEQAAAVLRHRDGALSVVKTAICTPMSCTARIVGTEGTIVLPAFMHCPDHLVVTTLGGELRLDCPTTGNGLHYQVVEVHRCLRAGLLESPIMPLDESLVLATTLDEMRAQIGLRYAGEEDPDERRAR